MFRRAQIVTVAALLAACTAPAAMAQQDRSPDEVNRDGWVLNRDYGSPDARDAAEHRGLYAVERDGRVLNRDYGSPDAQDRARDLPPVQTPAPTVAIRELPQGGFDWGDAGIGAVGMVALFGIAAGSALLVTNRRRRRGPHVATH